MVVVWIDIWDSQSSSSAKNIINHYFNIGQFVATIQGTNVNLGILQYKNCWKQGHTTLNCHSHVSRYTKCYGAHSTKHHRERAWCCMENKKTNQVATKVGELCPYTFKCMNCKGNHQVDSISCPYWHNHFNKDQHGRKQQKLWHVIDLSFKSGTKEQLLYRSNIRELNKELCTGQSTLYTTFYGLCELFIAYPKPPCVLHVV